jgi:hypothetical protein
MKTMTIIYASSIPVAILIGISLVAVFIIRSRRKRRRMESFANVDKTIFSKVNPMHEVGLSAADFASASSSAADIAAGSSISTVVKVREFDNTYEFEVGESESKDGLTSSVQTPFDSTLHLRIRSPSFNRHQFGKHQSFERGYLSETIKAWEKAQNSDNNENVQS